MIIAISKVIMIKKNQELENRVVSGWWRPESVLEVGGTVP